MTRRSVQLTADLLFVQTSHVGIVVTRQLILFNPTEDSWEALRNWREANDAADLHLSETNAPTDYDVLSDVELEFLQTRTPEHSEHRMAVLTLHSLIDLDPSVDLEG